MEDTLKTNDTNQKLLFGEWLVGKDLLTHRKLHEALSDQYQRGGRLGEVLLRLKLIDSDPLSRSLAEYLGVEYLSLDNPSEIDLETAQSIPEKIAARFCLIAINEDDDGVTIAMADPLNIVAIDTVTLKLKRKIKVVLSSTVNIVHAIDSIYHGSRVAEDDLRELVELELGDEEDDFVENELLEMDIRDEEMLTLRLHTTEW